MAQQIINKIVSIGFSPCPNDCFIFDAMINGKVDTEGLLFDVVMEDVEALNKKAFEGKLDVTKLSFNAYTHLTSSYQLLNSGSALGVGCGPLLVAKSNIKVGSETKIAIPGKYTTANLLFSLAFPMAKNKIEMVFSEIENAVINNEVDAGLIIHENRFTYEQKGLLKIIDLGEYWESLTNTPIPLGGIVVKRSFSDELKTRIDRVLRRSIEFAFVNPNSSFTFVKANAQEMSENVVKQHINLYVNDYSIELGKKGKQAIEVLFEKAQALGLIKEVNKDIFIN